MKNGRLTREERRWLLWLLTVGTSFAILEAEAIRNKKTEATLTWTLRKHLGIHPVRPWRMLGTGVVVGFSGWFAVHIVTGGLVPRCMSTIEELVHELENAGEDV